MDYEKICYIKSCLSQVIVRLDFLEHIDEDVLLCPDVEREVLRIFPKKGMRQIIRYQTMNVIADVKGGTKTEQTTKDGIRQEYSNADGNKIVLSNKFFVLEVNKYTRYEDMFSVIEPILKSLLDKSQLTAMRTGVRYINFFNDEGIKPQKNYFIPSVGALFDPKQEDKKCVRSMAMNEYIYEDMHLNFRYGMYNPQYPQIIKKSSYVLDYDCFCDEAIMGYDAIIAHIQKGHIMIQSLFEDSITDQLRKVMQNE